MNNAYIRLLVFLYTAEKSSVDYEIAVVLMREYNRFPNILIEDIAKQACTTASAVTKFCHKLNYKSFKELRNDCICDEQLQVIPKQLELAQTSYKQACLSYLEQEQHNLAFYMQYHDEAMIQKAASLMRAGMEIGVCYAPYSYTCVHVMRNYLEMFHIQVQGVPRDLDEDFMAYRLKSSALIWLISLQGTWIKEHWNWLIKLKGEGKTFLIITATYEERFKELTPYIFPFQFKDTILDTAAQISCLFVKLAFAYANFPKLEKS